MLFCLFLSVFLSFFFFFPFFLPREQTAVAALKDAGVHYTVFADVAIEPTDVSLAAAITFAQRHAVDGFLAVGGGSVMDTAKVANLFCTYPDHSLLDFVNAPVGKGIPVPGKLRPLFCVPTTSGTGSETTGTAIFDYEPLKARRTR